LLFESPHPCNKQDNWANQNAIPTFNYKDTAVTEISASFSQKLASETVYGKLLNQFQEFSAASCLHPLASVISKTTGPTRTRLRLLLSKIQPLQQLLPHLATNLAAKACFFCYSTNFKKIPQFLTSTLSPIA
jgi:hypothetical protein